MNVKSIENFIASIKLIQNTEKHILVYSDNNFFIKKLLFDFFTDAKEESYSIAINRLKDNNNLSYTELESIKKSINDIVTEITSSEKNKKYISYSSVIFSQEIVNYISNKLTGLFKRKIFVFLLLSSILSSAYILFFHQISIEVINVSFLEICMSCLMIFIILLFHEIGHASASLYYKIKPKEIGFGFYLIFPVLFANVTNIWVLKTGQNHTFILMLIINNL